MPQLLLAANLIENASPLGWGHLQIVRVDDDGSQKEIEVQAPWDITAGHWTFPNVRDHTTSAATSNYGVAGEYNAVELDLGDRLVDDVWELLVSVHQQFADLGTGITYDVEQNSNSYASTLLEIIGLKFESLFSAVRPETVSSFPGGGLNVLEKKDTAFGLTLEGCSHDDYIKTGIKVDHLSGGAGKDELHAGDGDDVIVGGNADINDMGGTSFHAEWDDGEQDILKGGFGLDTYYIAHDQIYRETTGTLAEQLELIDVIDERDGDGRGSLVIQHRLDEATYSVASAGEYELSWQDEDGSWYQKIDFEFGRDLTVLVSTILDENNNPLVFLIPAFESLDIAYAAIKGFRQGDFGIDLAGYIGPKEGTDGDDVILNDGSGGSLRSAGTQSDSVTWDSDPDANQRIDAGAGNDIVYGRAGQDELRGGDGDDQLFGGDDDDLLSGGTDDDHLQGDDGNDTFLFRNNFGHDTIVDFIAGEASDDVIDIDAFADFAAVLAAATQVGDDTLITTDANNSVLLKNIAVANLHQDDFRFSAAA